MAADHDISLGTKTLVDTWLDACRVAHDCHETHAGAALRVV